MAQSFCGLIAHLQLAVGKNEGSIRELPDSYLYGIGIIFCEASYLLD